MSNTKLYVISVSLGGCDGGDSQGDWHSWTLVVLLVICSKESLHLFGINFASDNWFLNNCYYKGAFENLHGEDTVIANQTFPPWVITTTGSVGPNFMKSRITIASIFQSQYWKLSWCSEVLSDPRSVFFTFWTQVSQVHTTFSEIVVAVLIFCWILPRASRLLEMYVNPLRGWNCIKRSYLM